MSDDIKDWMKKNHITRITEDDADYEEKVKGIVSRSEPLCTIHVVRPSKGDMGDDGIGVHVTWGDKFGNPSQWDKENLNAEQVFCYVLMVKLQELMMDVAAANEKITDAEAKTRRSQIRPVTKDNYQDILDQMEAIDKDKMN